MVSHEERRRRREAPRRLLEIFFQSRAATIKDSEHKDTKFMLKIPLDVFHSYMSSSPHFPKGCQLCNEKIYSYVFTSFTSPPTPTDIHPVLEIKPLYRAEHLFQRTHFKEKAVVISGSKAIDAE